MPERQKAIAREFFDAMEVPGQPGAAAERLARLLTLGDADPLKTVARHAAWHETLSDKQKATFKDAEKLSASAAEGQPHIQPKTSSKHVAPLDAAAGGVIHLPLAPRDQKRFEAFVLNLKRSIVERGGKIGLDEFNFLEDHYDHPSQLPPAMRRDWEELNDPIPGSWDAE